MKKILLLGAALFATTLAMTESAQAQRENCECVNGVKCYRLPDGTLDCDNSVTCEGGFTVTPPIPPGPVPVNSTATPDVLKATVDVIGVGPVEITLDNTRPAPPTTLSSNNPGQRFPLTADLNFNVTATTPAAPGTVFENVQPLNYKTTDAYSIAPFQEVKLTLQADVLFIDKATGAPAFTLEAGTSSITLGPDLGGPEGR